MRTILFRRLDELGVAYRENVSVPKGSGGAGKVLVCFDEKNTFLTMFDKVKQAFVRDPDGYYLEFCRLFAKRALETSFSPN